MPNLPKLIKVDALTYACNVCPKWEVHINAKKKLNAGQIAREIAKREALHIKEAHSPKVGDPVVRHDSPVVYEILEVLREEVSYARKHNNMGAIFRKSPIPQDLLDRWEAAVRERPAEEIATLSRIER